MRDVRFFAIGSGLLVAAWCAAFATQPPLAQGKSPVAQQVLYRHLPRIVSHDQKGELARMTLWAMGTDGLRERVFESSDDRWSDWTVRGVPPGTQLPPSDWDDLGRQLLADGGYAAQRSHVAVAYHYPTAGVQPRVNLALCTDAEPFGSAAGYAQTPYATDDWFQPLTAVPDTDPNRFHVYGNWYDGGLHSPTEVLVSLSFDVDSAGRVRPVHAAPNARPTLVANVGSTPKEMLVAPGPNSAVHVPSPPGGGSRRPMTLVFVKREPKDGTAGHEGLALWHDDGKSTSAWYDLGTPTAPPCEIVDRPLAFTWHNRGLDRISVNVFVVARRGEGSGRYELYERYWSVDGDSSPEEGWSGWKNHGSPLWDPYDAGKGRLLQTETKWRLTTATVWELDGKTRINVFGPANAETDRDGVAQPRRLVEYVWDGARWSWGFPHEAPPSGLGVRTISSAWVNQDDALRISIACRDDAGSVLERYYTIDERGWRGWFWNDLTD